MPTNTSTSANKANPLRRAALLCGITGASLAFFVLTAGCVKQYPGDPDPNIPRPPRKPPTNAGAPAPVPNATRSEGR
jgi:hypothetical protein